LPNIKLEKPETSTPPKWISQGLANPSTSSQTFSNLKGLFAKGLSQLEEEWAVVKSKP